MNTGGMRSYNCSPVLAVLHLNSSLRMHFRHPKERLIYWNLDSSNASHDIVR